MYTAFAKNEASGTGYLADFLATADGLALARAFVRLDCGLMRRVVALVEEIAGK